MEAPRRRRSSDESVPEIGRSAQKNYARRQRRRSKAAKEEAIEVSIGKQLKRVRKALRGVEELLNKEELSDEQRAKLERRDGLEASLAALEAISAEEERARQRQDAIVEALERVSFDRGLECGVCFDVLEVPTATPCGHEFCRGCIEAVVRRARRGADVACPLCRATFYDGTTKTARLEAAVATRHKLKTTTGTCHCGVRVPLSGLRDHLRKCGDPASYYPPRPKFGHTFAKPDFAKALAAAPAVAPSVDADLAAAMVRRFETVGGPRAPPSPQVPVVVPEEHHHQEEEEERDATPPAPSPRASRVAGDAWGRDAWRPHPTPQGVAIDVTPGVVFRTPVRVNNNLNNLNQQNNNNNNSSSSSSSSNKRSWAASPKPQPRNLHAILAEEEAKQQDVTERITSPWSGAVARSLRGPSLA
ncbi:hypothetical protein CTAYLR_004915 [Chrysophaeum taylorii]|uniref:RING-type domain-containing protein n=1 Tax=Chrysophaeum taylorii TaxID=2483200 RepID=A0AAD7UQ48_9STRA|nr:hypothetical protein CTAYLR_004915 [Chrysophaeum taylorii]